ncbi:MAG: AAA family ATPase [Acidobacteria bacterium]|nr:AAA family ATPase [Acidobacteriota bacterium]
MNAETRTATLVSRVERKEAPRAERLTPEQLYRACDPTTLGFRTTDELPDGAITLGQDRAVSAVQFGIGIRDHGYNLFAFGPAHIGKHAIVRQFLEERAASEPAAPDWCYVHNFEEPHRPRALSLPAGTGVRFRADMARLVDELRIAVVAALNTEEYRLRHQQIDEEFAERRREALSDLGKRAEARGVALIHTPVGFALVPTRDGQPLGPEAFGGLPESERHALKATLTELEAELERLLHQVPQWQRERREKDRALKQAVTRTAVEALIDDLAGAYAGQPDVQAYLAAVKADVVEHADDFRAAPDENDRGPIEALMTRAGLLGDRLNRYQVNVLVDRSGAHGAPVVYEDKPTFQGLVGRIEHVAQMGALVTHFTLIKPGALHRANGGYLLLDARRLLLEPFAWEGLKRALRARTLRAESLGEALSLISTVSLDPQPIPLDVKVVLIGEPVLYYLLHALDPDFTDLFKVAVDFEATVDRAEPGSGSVQYAGLIGTLARRAGLRPVSAAGVARLLEHGARVVGHADKLWLGLDGLTDLLKEASYWAGTAGGEIVEAADVERAIEARLARSSRPRERLQEEIARGTIAIATGGEVVGQVNGLSVVELGGFTFGRPSRITARVRLGGGTVVDIEREVELGGPIHSKGVLILSGFLAGRYVPDEPLSLAASIVFEQSYGLVEGDSASSAELCALLSALADLPVRQSIAVTGSVNQRGEIQAVGGINEKIEGFFDVCAARGLTGAEGVLIPAANKRHLMLRADVIAAVRAGRFHVYAVDTVDQVMEVLTGVAAGERDVTGRFPSGTVNCRVEQRLEALARQARSFRMGATDASRA